MKKPNKWMLAVIPFTVGIFILVSSSPVLSQNKPFTSRSFDRIQLSSTFFAEGAGIGDINQDGNLDVVAGPYWYEGPKFKNKHEIYEPRVFDPRRYSDNFIVELQDINGDDRNDILVVGFPGEAAYWYENTSNNEGDHWPRHLIHSKVDNESPGFYDITGDEEFELVFHTDGYLGYAKKNQEDPTQPWSFQRISNKQQWGKFTHGLGIGDLNNDGYDDFIKEEGWWENPGSDSADQQWEYHEVDFGPGGAQMLAYDVDSDGKNDVITALDAHGWGLAWYKQISENEFEQNLIMDANLRDNPFGVRFSQPHALKLLDVDNDGVKDVVSGKRFWAHGPLGGFEPNAPAVVYWFKLYRTDQGTAKYIPYLVDDNSGVGVEIASDDLTGNGYPDIVTSNKNGTFIFLNNSQGE